MMGFKIGVWRILNMADARVLAQLILHHSGAGALVRSEVVSGSVAA